MSIAVLVRKFQKIPEHLANESLFMYNGIKFPDGSVLSKSDYEKITGYKHYHRSHENFGKNIKVEVEEDQQQANSHHQKQ